VLNNGIKFLQKYKIENHSISLFTHAPVSIPANSAFNREVKRVIDKTTRGNDGLYPFVLCRPFWPSRRGK
jgi:hypothetical protein